MQEVSANFGQVFKTPTSRRIDPVVEPLYMKMLAIKREMNSQALYEGLHRIVRPCPFVWAAEQRQFSSA